MRLHRLNRVKMLSVTFLLLSATFSVALKMVLPQVYAQSTIIAVYPSINEANPTEYFTINVTVADVVDLRSYEAKIGFDENVLEAVNATEGPFIKDQLPPLHSTFFTSNIYRSYVHVSCITLGPSPGVSGSGTLFSITFTVKIGGESPLDIYDTQLSDKVLADIAHSISDGSFRTRAPAASFSFSPDTLGRPIAGENVTFDASNSFDPSPGGAILDYAWNFGDGTNGTGKIVNHTYSEPTTLITPYNVTLKVTDNENETSLVSREVHVYFHDITILEIEAPDEIYWRESALIDVTVVNNGSHTDYFNVTAYYNSAPIETEIEELGLLPGANKTYTFDWVTFINQTEKGLNATTIGTWIYPLNASTSDDEYTYSNSNQSYQVYKGYVVDTTGWSGISKVEVGVEVKTEAGGDDMLSIQVFDGKIWGEEHLYNITSTTDTFFWVDVTGSLSWEPGFFRNDKVNVKIKYIQIGGESTLIYVDYLPMRITPLNPADIPLGTYAIWANVYLVNPYTFEFRPGEEEDTADNTLFGDPIVITKEPLHDIAVTNVTVNPTRRDEAKARWEGEVALGRTATVEVEVENNGNTDETFDVFLYANSTMVANETGLRLRAGRTETIRFTWFEATDNQTEGVYNITAVCGRYNETTGNVDLLLNETDTTNNRQNLTVLMRLLPEPVFTYSPLQPTMGAEVTFNASNSYAPGIPRGTIDRYIWDFGDGANGTDMIVSHTYDEPGAYVVRLMVVDDENLNHTKTESIRVPKLTSTISLYASPVNVPLSLNTTISGSILPVRANVTVTINYTSVELAAWLAPSNISTWTTLSNVTTDDDGQYSYAWKPERNGTYQFIAFWEGDALTEGANSSLLEVTVALRNIAIVDVALSEIRLMAGENLTINVTATNRGTATETFNVTILYNNTLLETKTIANLTAGSSETVNFDWNTQGMEMGVYIIDSVAEPLPGETYVADNSRSSGVIIEAHTQLNIFLYTTVGLAIAIVAMAVYLVRMIKFKPK